MVLTTPDGAMIAAMAMADGHLAEPDWYRKQAATLGTRLEAAEVDVDAKADALKLSRRLRDELVVQAVELGMPLREVARHAGVTHSRVVAILASH